MDLKNRMTLETYMREYAKELNDSTRIKVILETTEHCGFPDGYRNRVGIITLRHIRTYDQFIWFENDIFDYWSVCTSCVILANPPDQFTTMEW